MYALRRRILFNLDDLIYILLSRQHEEECLLPDRARSQAETRGRILAAIDGLSASVITPPVKRLVHCLAGPASEGHISTKQGRAILRDAVTRWHYGWISRMRAAFVVGHRKARGSSSCLQLLPSDVVLAIWNRAEEHLKATDPLDPGILWNYRRGSFLEARHAGKK